MIERFLGPGKMRKPGLRRVTTIHGNLTHLIFVRPHPSRYSTVQSMYHFKLLIVERARTASADAR